MKSILTILFVIPILTISAQVKVEKSWNKRYKGVEGIGPYNLRIASAYWKEDVYHLKFVCQTERDANFDQSVSLEDGKLDLRFTCNERTSPFGGNYYEFYYQISGLNSKDFKLRFNGHRQGSYPIYALPEPVFPDFDYPIEEIEEAPEPIDQPFKIVEQQPRWGGCETSECSDVKMLKYLSDNTKYPELAKEIGMEGRVFVQFVVEKNGELSNIKVVKGVDKSLDKEAIRVIKSMPKWEPGKQRGKAVRCLFTIPIKFVLQ